MSKKTAIHWLAAISLASIARQGSPQQTEPFHYSQGFEDGADPVQFWLSYGKKYTVNAKGVTDEKACTGKRSLKLDVTFDETSRFLWHIPMEKRVPVGGRLTFSGRLLVGEETTGTATLGVSFCFPPTKHTACTAPNTFYQSTGGDWATIEDDIVPRSRAIALSVMGHYTAGVRGEHVSPFLERIMIDLRGESGQRVVLYVDDLEIIGEVPTEEAYREEMARRWAPVEQALDETLAAWEAQLSEVDRKLPSQAHLRPRAAAIRQAVADRTAKLRAQIADIRDRGYLNLAEPMEFDGFFSSLSHILPNIQAVSELEAKGGRALIYVVPPISSVKVLPDDILLCGTVADELSLTAARGEYEPASFVVSARGPLKSLRITTHDVRGESGVIPAANVDVKVIKCWYQAGTAWVGIRQDKSKRLLTPELLLNDDGLVRVDHERQENYLRLRFPDGEKEVWISDPTEVRTAKPMSVESFPVKDSPVLLPVDVPAGTNKQFWVTVRVPADARPGEYAGTISLSTSEGAIAELTLRVRVLPLELLPPYYTSSMDYHGRLDPSGKGTISSWIKNRTQFRNELANMVAHGLRNCQHYNIRKEILGEVLKIRAEVGMDNRTLYLKNTIPIGNLTDPAALEAIKRNVKDILDFVKDYGTETVYFYGMDERRGDELVSQRPAWTAVREAGGKIFVAGYEENVDLMGDIQDMHVRAGPPWREEVEKWHALGHKIFCYANPQTGVENPVIYRRNFGLLLWKYDYDGAATNAYQHTFGATWNDFDHPTYRAHTIAYPTVDGVIDTIAWEGYREGVDDVRYVTTLQAAVAKAAKSPDPVVRQKAATAREFLERLETGTEIESGDLDAIRREIVEHIMALAAGAVP
jgi:hypothetical protein